MLLRSGVCPRTIRPNTVDQWCQVTVTNLLGLLHNIVIVASEVQISLLLTTKAEITSLANTLFCVLSNRQDN